MAFILDEHFTTGSRPTGWFSGSDGDFGYATSPAPLEGSYSLRQAAGSVGSLYVNGSEVTGEQWGHTLFNLSALPASFAFLVQYLDESVATKTIAIGVFADGTMFVDLIGGVTFGSTSSSIMATTTYHLWWRYKPGSGTNAEGEIWINTSNDRAGTAAGFHALKIDGTAVSSDGIQYPQVVGNSGIDLIVDTFQWADTDEFAGGGGGSTIPVFMNQYRQRWG